LDELTDVFNGTTIDLPALLTRYKNYLTRSKHKALILGPCAYKLRGRPEFMSMPVKQMKSVYDAFLEVPSHKVAQIINGELRVMSRPRPQHAMASSSLGDELVSHSKKVVVDQVVGLFLMNQNCI
jgi:hypothetical protein